MSNRRQAVLAPQFNQLFQPISAAVEYLVVRTTHRGIESQVFAEFDTVVLKVVVLSVDKLPEPNDIGLALFLNPPVDGLVRLLCFEFVFGRDLVGQKVADIDSFSIKILIVEDGSRLALDIDPPNAFTRLAIMRNVTADAAAKMGPQRTRGGIPESPFRFRPIAAAIGTNHGLFESPHHQIFWVKHRASSSSVA